ncbi:PREDICTED: uncharacterized protein At3g43530-like [Camelina sativa]|uniref:Uncharacterized protein At3g43530-like n=1 Tax=Camelina sativa TaxID=90675 RepID=A0ABM0U3Y6_CAMSA|nr:PREDICTED: uncharacterized protein At3g43530-like [Camelina sativa]
MCKIKFKPSTMKGYPLSDVYDKLDTTKDIQSILTPTDDKEILLQRIMDDQCGLNDFDDVIADGWKNPLVHEGRTICFEELYNQDIASRANEANMVTETVNMAPRKVRQGKKDKGKGKVAPKNVSIDGLAELVYGLKTVVENGFQSIKEKHEEQDKRLKIMEASIQSFRLSAEENELRGKEVKTSHDGSGTARSDEDGGDKENENEKMEKDCVVYGGDKENEVGEKEEMEKDSVVDGGDKENEVGEKEEMEKEVAEDEEIQGGEKVMEIEKEVTQDDEMEMEIGKDDKMEMEIGKDDEMETEIVEDDEASNKEMLKMKSGKEEEKPSKGGGKKTKKNAKKVVYQSPIGTRGKEKENEEMEKDSVVDGGDKENDEASNKEMLKRKSGKEEE